MSRIERTSKIIASKISNNLSIDEDHEEVIAYGAYALLQTGISILAVIIFGVIFNVLTEALVISIAAATLRKFSGGEHATEPMSCVLIGMAIFGGLAILVKHVIIKLDLLLIITFMIISLIIVLHIIFKYSPVGSINKPLKKEATRSRLRKQSLKCVFIFMILIIMLMGFFLVTKNLYFLKLAIAIITGMLWQSITLVSLGKFIINILDKMVLGGTNLIKGGQSNEK